MGVTYVVLAPEHALVKSLTTADQKEAVENYIAIVSGKSDLERTSTGKDRGKTGVFLGSYVTHPLTGAKLPVWTADYVLAGYGSGAVMAVPAHDERDYAFAQKFVLPIVRVVRRASAEGSGATESEELPYTEPGVACNSGALDGLTTKDCFEAVVKLLSEKSAGGKQVTYRLRDWVFSRQRYWYAMIDYALHLLFI